MVFQSSLRSHQQFRAGRQIPIRVFDFYVTDFGTLKVVPNRFQDNAAYLIDTNHASLRQLRPASRQALAKTGDAQKVLVVEEWAFQCDNKDAHAVIRDLS